MKYIIAAVLVIGLIGLLFPRLLRRLLGGAGRGLGDLGRAGKELATGEEVRNSPLARYEVRAGEIVARRVLERNPVSTDPALQDTVARVGARLAVNASRREIPYRFAAVEAGEPNAFAVPGGSIFVTRPLVDLCEGDESRLAGVIAHEIVHIDRRHAIRTLATSTAVRTGMKVLALSRAFFLAQISSAMEELIVNGYRQEQELEADALGVRLAASAGFSPGGLLELLERLQESRPDGRGALEGVLAYFKTHPPFAARRANVLREVARIGG